MSEFVFSNLSLPLQYGKMSLKLEFLEKWILSFHQEKTMDFEYCEEYLRSTSNKIWQGKEK